MIDRYPIPQGFKIVSGGQTGADRAGLDWAIAHDVAHGGWCPKDHRAEDGQIDPRYGLTETPSANYLQRSEWNVRDSDATVIFTLAEELTGGSLKTAELAQRLGKPYVQMSPRVHPKYLARFLAAHSVRTLNVAGSRESSAPGIRDRVIELLDAALVL